MRVDEVAAAEIEAVSEDDEDKVVRAEEEEEKQNEKEMESERCLEEKTKGETFYYWPILPQELCRRWEVKKAIM